MENGGTDGELGEWYRRGHSTISIEEGELLEGRGVRKITEVKEELTKICIFTDNFDKVEEGKKKFKLFQAFISDMYRRKVMSMAYYVLISKHRI